MSNQVSSGQDFVIRGASLLGGETVDIRIADGIFTEVSTSKLDTTGAQELDAAGLVALPGLVDLHTHLREPGREDAETVETGTQAAALGGFTSVHAMANTDPVADTAGVVEQVWRLGRVSGWVDVNPVGAVSIGLRGEHLADLGAMAHSAASVRVFSDDGHCVSDPLLMRRALEYVRSFDGVIAQHSQDPRLTEGSQMHEGEISAELGLTGWPAVAEESVIARDVLLAGHVGSRLHVCHVSTAGSVEIIRWAKARGIQVTAEATPHHLLLNDELVRGYNPLFKVNPPLRSTEDVSALRAGVADGTIDIIGTDHAPHADEDKDCEWAVAAMGISGLEVALSIVQQTLVDSELISWRDVARVLSAAPARIGRLTHQGRPVAAGEPANLTLIDPSARRIVDPEAFASLGKNSPLAGTALPGQVHTVFLRGVRTVSEGALANRLDERCRPDLVAQVAKAVANANAATA